MQSTRKRKGSGDIPFGYNLDSSDRYYIVPNEEHLESLQEVEESVVVGFLNLREGTEWLKYKTGKDISIKGLQKKIIKKYGRSDSEERLGHRSRLLSARR
jgi:hypothetical protein